MKFHHKKTLHDYQVVFNPDFKFLRFWMNGYCDWKGWLFMFRQHMLRTLKQLLNTYDFFPVDDPKRKASAKEFFSRMVQSHQIWRKQNLRLPNLDNGFWNIPQFLNFCRFFFVAKFGYVLLWMIAVLLLPHKKIVIKKTM